MSDITLQNIVDEDEIIFVEDNPEEQIENGDKWKVIIADDDSDVHQVTELVLEGFVFEGKGLHILSAYSEIEVNKLIRDNPDTAVIFLDVIMEKEDSGLNVVKYIREELKNSAVRIILRTGQPGQAPEEQTILNYDINDYKEKTEFTSKKLFTSIITALRAYRHIRALENSKKGLEKIITSSSEIFRKHFNNDFFDILIKCIISIISTGNNRATEKISGFVALNNNDNFHVVCGEGDFSEYVDFKLQDVVNEDIYNIIRKSYKENTCSFNKNFFTACFKLEPQLEFLVFIECEHAFSEIEEDLLSVFFSNAIVTFNNMCLSNEIESTQKEILFTLGGIAEARSNELGQHVIRVAEYAKIIALGYGFSEEEAELIKQAAPMHDIGKIAIPDEVLNKPGKLTPEEFEIMKLHSQLGYDILKTSKRKTLQAAAIIAISHHEKYNGTGYPNKLKEDEIHIYGRIAAIADVFDALGCNRVYKKAWELDKILELFEQERGKHFDPVLVDILFKELDKILEVRKLLPD